MSNETAHEQLGVVGARCLPAIPVEPEAPRHHVGQWDPTIDQCERARGPEGRAHRELDTDECRLRRNGRAARAGLRTDDGGLWRPLLLPEDEAPRLAGQSRHRCDVLARTRPHRRDPRRVGWSRTEEQTHGSKVVPPDTKPIDNANGGATGWIPCAGATVPGMSHYGASGSPGISCFRARSDHRRGWWCGRLRSMDANRRVLIARLPAGALSPGDFALDEVPVRSPEEGEVVIETAAFTIGAGQRAGLQGSASYAGAAQADTVMGGTGVGVVIVSIDAGFVVGERDDRGPSVGRNMRRSKARHSPRLTRGIDPATQLGALGTNGLTAYFGLLDVGDPQPARPSSSRPPRVRSGTSSARSPRSKAPGWSASWPVRRQVSAARCRSRLRRRRRTTRAPSSGPVQGRDPGPYRRLLRQHRRRHPRLAPCSGWPPTAGSCAAVSSASTTRRRRTRARGASPVCWSTTGCGWKGSCCSTTPTATPKGGPGSAEWLAAGRLRPLATEFEGLESAGQAFVELLAGRTVGTTLVRVGPTPS